MATRDISPMQSHLTYSEYQEIIQKLVLSIVESSPDYSKSLEAINKDLRRALDFIKKTINETYK